VKKTNKVLVVHEDTKTGGIAGEIAAILCEKAFGDLDGPLMRVASLDTPVPYAPTLEDYFLPNAQKVFTSGKRSWLVTRFWQHSRSWLYSSVATKRFLATEVSETESQRKEKKHEGTTPKLFHLLFVSVSRWLCSKSSFALAVDFKL